MSKRKLKYLKKAVLSHFQQNKLIKSSKMFIALVRLYCCCPKLRISSGPSICHSRIDLHIVDLHNVAPFLLFVPRDKTGPPTHRKWLIFSKLKSKSDVTAVVIINNQC